MIPLFFTPCVWKSLREQSRDVSHVSLNSSGKVISARFCLVSLKCESSRDLHSADWTDYEEIEDNLNLSIQSLVAYNKRVFLEARLSVNCNARVGSSYFKSHLGSSFIPLPISIRPYLNWHARESVFVSSPFSPGHWALGSNANAITHRQIHCEFKIGFI